MKIQTQINIKASAKTVWSILTDFEAYPEWNPFIRHLSGDKSVGGRLKADIGSMQFKPLVQVYEEEQAISWLGSLFFKGLFDGLHSFQIVPVGEGSCKFVHREDFSGILVPLFRKKLMTETKAGFEQMNKAIKSRAEGMN